MNNRRNTRPNKKRKNKKKLIIVNTSLFLVWLIIILILISLFFTFLFINKFKNKENSLNDISTEITSSNTEKENFASSNITEKTTKDITINLAFTGDIMCHNTMFKDAYNSNEKNYDFSYFFDDIKYYLQTPDLTVGNLETTFAGEKIGYSGYPTFNTPESLAKTLKNTGFDVVSTANNHCLDKGYNGISNTISYLDEADISHTGTFTSEESKSNILVKNVKGIKIAFLSFTYGTNGIAIPSGKEYCVNLYSKENILSQLDLAKKTGSDLICVSMHWGIEYQTKPNKEQKDLAEFLIKNGADLIIGNHPHVPQSMELKTVNLDDGSSKEAFVIYSLGNFMADQNKSYTRDSAILNLKYTKHADDSKTTFNSATYTPIYVYKNKSLSSKKFKILDINSSIQKYEEGTDKTIGQSMYNTLCSELENIKKIIGNEITK